MEQRQTEVFHFIQCLKESRKPVGKRISKDDVAISYQFVVEGVCRRIIEMVDPLFPTKIPNDTQELILFFYAKPLEMNLVNPGSNLRDTVLICPIMGFDWDYVKGRVLGCIADASLTQFYMHLPSHHFCLEHLSSTDGKQEVHFWNWDPFKWCNDEGHFRVKHDWLMTVRMT